jgi:hypothetical protein
MAAFTKPTARAEAWKRYALRQMELREQAEIRADDAVGAAVAVEIGGCQGCADLREENRELQREARDEARGAYGEGYARGRDDAGEDY